jgi:hypothetical protein
MQQSGIPAAADVREVFEQVLADPDFQYAGTSPIIGWFRAAAQWIEDFLSRWIPVLGDTEARILSWFLLVAVVGGMIYLIVRRFSDRGPSVRRPALVGGSPAQRPRDASDWMAWAAEAARAGRLRDAATGLYQATVLRLDARGALRYREWKTPGDYALEVTDDDQLRGPFLDFLSRFLEVAFGPTEPTSEAFEALSAGAARIGDSA